MQTLSVSAHPRAADQRQSGGVAVAGCLVPADNPKPSTAPTPPVASADGRVSVMGTLSLRCVHVGEKEETITLSLQQF